MGGDGDDEFQPAFYASLSRSFMAMMGQWVNSRNSRTHQIEIGCSLRPDRGGASGPQVASAPRPA